MKLDILLNSSLLDVFIIFQISLGILKKMLLILSIFIFILLAIWLLIFLYII